MSAWVWMMGMWIRTRVPAPLGSLIFDVSGTWSMASTPWRPRHIPWQPSPAPNASYGAARSPRAPPPESRPASRTAGRSHHNIYATEPENPQYLAYCRLPNPQGLVASPSGYRPAMGSAFVISARTPRRPRAAAAHARPRAAPAVARAGKL